MSAILIIVTLVALATAVATGAVAWRLVRLERRRSEARVSSLAAEIREVDGAGDQMDEAAPTRLSHELLSASGRPEPPSRLAAVAIVGSLVVGTAVALIAGFSRASRPAPQAAAVAHVEAPATAESPLELVVLGHERIADRLTVRGAIRNPAAAGAGITAVVTLFGSDGRLIASGRAPVDAREAAGRSESTFVITVPGAADVERYRVSFKQGERTLPHVDARSS